MKDFGGELAPHRDAAGGGSPHQRQVGAVHPLGLHPGVDRHRAMSRREEAVPGPARSARSLPVVTANGMSGNRPLARIAFHRLRHLAMAFSPFGSQ